VSATTEGFYDRLQNTCLVDDKPLVLRRPIEPARLIGTWPRARANQVL